MGGEVVAAGAEVGDLTEPADGSVPTVCGRHKGLQVDKFVGPATFAVRATRVVGIRERGCVGVAAATDWMLGGGAAVRCRRQRTLRLQSDIRRCGRVGVINGWRHCRPIPNAPVWLPDGTAVGSVRFRIVVMGLFLTFNVSRIGHRLQVINGRSKYTLQVAAAQIPRSAVWMAPDELVDGAWRAGGGPATVRRNA